MDVLTAAWQACGQPLPAVHRNRNRGACARCGRADDELVPTRDVVSKVFTGYDTWRDPSGSGLCPACTWAYRTPELRAVAHLVTFAPPCLQQLEPAALADLLSVAVPADLAVIVPLRPGRKHLLPAAVWGRVTVDDAQLPWTAADADRLAAMRRLRALGFGSRMLTEPAPVWSVLRKLPRNWVDQVLTDWAALDPWRSRPPWFDLAVRASFVALPAAA